MDLETLLDERRLTLAERVLSDGRGIDAHDVRIIRREIYDKGAIVKEDAALLFHLNHHAKGNDPAWAEAFVECLTDYFVWQQTPTGVLSVDDAHFLIDSILRDGEIDTKTEFGLLVNIIHHSEYCPDEVAILSLESIKSAVMHGSGVLFGPNRRRPGVIDGEDVASIRRVVYGGGGNGGYSVSHAEADLLFELKKMTEGKRNSEDWPPLFVQAVGSFLVHPAQPYRYDADARQRQESWLNDRRGVEGLLGDTVMSVFRSRGAAVAEAKEPPEVEAPPEAVDEIGDEYDEAEAKKSLGLSEMVARHMAERAAVSAPEAEWLIEKIGHGDTFDDLEKALLAFVKTHALDIHPSLNPLLAQAGLLD